MRTDAFSIATEKTQLQSRVKSFQPHIKRVVEVDLRALALCRITTALIVLIDLLERSQSLVAHYTDAGVLPRFVLLDKRFQLTLDNWWSLHLMGGSAFFEGVLFILAALAAIALLLGYRSKSAALCSWVLLISIVVRNPIIGAGEVLLKAVLLWSIFLPIGARFSVDARQIRNEGAPLRESQGLVSIAATGLLIQIALVFFCSALLKRGAAWHAEGTALYYALQSDQYLRVAGLWLSEAPEGVLRFLTHFTWYTELIAPLLIFSPIFSSFFRTLAGLWLIGMVASFGICLNLGILHLVAISALLVVLPCPFWEWMFRVQIIHKVFEIVAQKLSSLAARFTKQGTQICCEPLRPIWLEKVTASLILGYIAFWNIATLPQVGVRVPEWLASGGTFFHLNQYWGMFAPAPGRWDGWFVAPALLESGAEIDLMHSGRAVSYEKPALVSAEFPDVHWRSYLMNLVKNKSLAPIYAHYLCRNWNHRAAPGEEARGVKVIFLLERALPPRSGITEPEPIELAEVRCSGPESQ